MLYIDPASWGHVAEWLRNGLQNRVHQFNSGRGLHQCNQCLTLITYEAIRTCSYASAGGVPAFGERDKRPGQLIVVCGPRRSIESLWTDQEVPLGRNGRTYGVQQ